MQTRYLSTCLEQIRPVLLSDILDLIQPEQKELVQEPIRQASPGAQGGISGANLIRPDDRYVRLDMVLRRVCWDSSPGVLIIT